MIGLISSLTQLFCCRCEKGRAKQHAQQLNDEEATKSLSAIFVPDNQATVQDKQEGRRRNERYQRVVEPNKKAKDNKRKINRGMNTRKQYTMHKELDVIFSTESWHRSEGLDGKYASFEDYFFSKYGSNAQAMFSNFRRWHREE